MFNGGGFGGGGMQGGQGGSLGGDLGSLFSSFMGSKQPNPYDAAAQYYNQIPGMLNQTYAPWMQQGMAAGNFLQPQYEGMVNNFNQNALGTYNQMAADPGGYLNQMGKGFQQSPGYQWQMNQALENMNKTAAAGGYAGTPQEQQQMGSVASGLANQDYYNWINHAQQMAQMGLGGLSQQDLAALQGLLGQQGIGANAANQYGQNMGSAMQNQGNLAAQQQGYQNQQQSGLWGSVGNLISNLL